MVPLFLLVFVKALGAQHDEYPMLTSSLVHTDVKPRGANADAALVKNASRIAKLMDFIVLVSSIYIFVGCLMCST